MNGMNGETVAEITYDIFDLLIFYGSAIFLGLDNDLTKWSELKVAVINCVLKGLYLNV